METMTEIEKRIELEALICEKEAMKIFNLERDRQGYAPGYNYDSFYELASKMRQLASERGI
jgi:hypothetical protein